MLCCATGPALRRRVSSAIALELVRRKLSSLERWTLPAPSLKLQAASLQAFKLDKASGIL